MQPSRHLALSAAAGGALWAATREPLALPVTIAAGVLVDVDHGPDLWWALALRREPVATFLLHGWEWLAGLVAFGIWAGFPWWLVAVLVGYALHLTTDQATNGRVRWSYSILYRAANGFQARRFAPHWDMSRTYAVLEREVPIAVWLIRRWHARSPVRAKATGQPAE